MVDLDGTVVKLSGTLMDETDRVEADRVRRAADARFELGFEQSGIGAGTMDLRGAPIRVNATVCALMDRPEDELVGHDWQSFCHPDDVPLGPEVRARLAAGHDTYTGERRFIRPDGTTVWTSLHLTLVRDEDGQPHYFLAQLQDISARKQTEAGAFLPGPPRLPDRPSEPRTAQRSPGPQSGRHAPAGHPTRRDVPRRRPLQGGQ